MRNHITGWGTHCMLYGETPEKQHKQGDRIRLHKLSTMLLAAEQLAESLLPIVPIGAWQRGKPKTTLEMRHAFSAVRRNLLVATQAWRLKENYTNFLPRCTLQNCMSVRSCLLRSRNTAKERCLPTLQNNRSERGTHSQLYGETSN